MNLLMLKALWSATSKIGSSLWAFFKTPLGRVVALLIVLLISHAWVWHRAETVVSARYERQIKAREDAALALMARRRAASAVVTADLQSKLDQEKLRRAPIQIIIKEVPRYVTPKADAQCVVPTGFVWLHNVPLTPGLADRPPGDVDAPSGVALSTVAGTVGWNYNECEYRKFLLDRWREWYDRNKVIFEKNSAKSMPPPP